MKFKLSIHSLLSQTCYKKTEASNAKVRLAHAGVQVMMSAKRRRAPFTFKKHKAFISGSYSNPDNYSEYLQQQMQAHLDGKQEGRSLFARYMPATCIQLLKDSSYWEIPHGFVHPNGIQMVDSSFSVGYNKLCVSLAEEKQDVLTGQEGQISETIDEEECVAALDTLTEETDEIQSNNECGDLDEPEPEEGGKKWKISRQL